VTTDHQPDGGRPGRRVTSADVARASGVSRATVSYVLNDVPGKSISEETRRVVRETADRLGHVPFGPARSLRLGRSNIVLALVRDYAIGFIADRALAALDAALAERGSVLLVHRFSDQPRPMRELWGLVSPSVVVSMAGLKIAEETFGGTTTKLVGVQGHFRQTLAGQRQVEYLHGRGHRQIGYAYPKDERVALIAKERLAGAEEQARTMGIAQPAIQTIDVRDPDSAVGALEAWARLPEPVTAIAAHNDEIALLLVDGLRKLGMEAGRDMAVIGVDNIPLARTFLTTLEIVESIYTGWIVEAVLAALDDRPVPESDPEFLRLIIRDTA